MEHDFKLELYANLTGAMGSIGLSKREMSSRLSIGYERLRSRFDGRAEWTRKEMVAICETYFPDKTIDWLFQRFE
jgi:hypothetical protein